MTTVQHRYSTVSGRSIFHRKPGPSDAPVLVLLPSVPSPAGAMAFGDDVPDAEIHLLDGGHFFLESNLDTAAADIRSCLGRTLSC